VRMSANIMIKMREPIWSRHGLRPCVVGLLASAILSMSIAEGATVANPQTFGAVGDGVADDTKAIQAAVDSVMASPNGGVLVLAPPKLAYRLTGPIRIGNGSAFLRIEITGAGFFSGANAPSGMVELRQEDPASDTFVINVPNNKIHSVVIRGVVIKYPPHSSGVAIHFANVTQQVDGCVLEKIGIVNPGKGISLDGGSVSLSIRDVTVFGASGAGLETAKKNNLLGLENVYLQSGASVGWSVPNNALIRGSHIDRLVIESNAGVALLIAGLLEQSTFTSCWWEFPASDMIQVRDGGKLMTTSFIGTVFDGSQAHRNVIHNAGLRGSNTQVLDITFIGGLVANLNGGSFLTVDEDPAASSDPGFGNITVLHTALSGSIRGLHTAHSHPEQFSVFQTFSMKDSDVVPNSVYHERPKYQLGAPGK
jgi:hypothetical protein